MTVVFHVDDMKVSHKSNKATVKVIEYLNGIYPGLKALCGDVHDYLGIIFGYSTKGQVEVPMIPYTKKLDELPEEITMTSTTPETENFSRFEMRKTRNP